VNSKWQRAPGKNQKLYEIDKNPGQIVVALRMQIFEVGNRFMQ